MCGVQLGTKI